MDINVFSDIMKNHPPDYTFSTPSI